MSSSSSHIVPASQLELPLPAPAPRDTCPDPVIRRSNKARRLQIRVSPWKGIEVVLPRRCSQREAQEFIAAHRDWMRKTWQKLLLEYPDAAGWELPQRIHLPLLDREWQVVLDPTGKRFSASARRITLVGSDDTVTQALRLQQWVRLKARTALERRLRPWVERSGLEPSGIAIRGQATRWGSCSSKGTLSLNFRLMFLAPELVDCLLLHELCHLRHMNHGKRFWSLMERHMPDARERDRALGAAWRDVPAWAQVRKD